MNKNTSIVWLRMVMIADLPKFMYNNLNIMLTQKLSIAALIVGLLVPVGASAYYSPEEVLLNKDYYLPPGQREGSNRVIRQAAESAARREREQEAAFALQRPFVAEPVIVEEAAPVQQPAFFAIPFMPGAGWPGMTGMAGFGAAPGGNTADAELLRTVRLLGRVRQNQQAAAFAQILHSAAGTNPLAPTGAPAVIAASAMIGSLIWTMRKAKKAEKKTIRM